MSLMDLFRGGNSSASSQQAAPQGGQANGQQAQPAPGQQQQPANSGEGNEASATGGSDSPLADFGKLWNNDNENSEGQNTGSLSSLININPQTIQEQVSKMDFSSAVSPEMLSQISEGGEAAQQAFAKALNSVAQQTFGQSMIANATLMQKVLEQADGSFNTRIDSRLRDSQVSQQLSETNPVMSNPAAQPLVQMVHSQLSKQYPNASTKELTEMASKYFDGLADSITAPKRQQEEQQRRGSEMDWDSWAQN